MNKSKICDGDCIPFGCLSVRKLQAILMKFSLTAYVVSTTLSGVVESINRQHLQLGATDWVGPGLQVVITSFFFGYLLTNIISGILVTQLNSRNMIMGSMICNGVITFITPTLINYTFWSGFCLSRFLVGLSSGFISPSIFDLLANWCPKSELIITGNIVFSGHYLGYVLSTLAAITFDSNESWPNVFYFSGGLSFLSGLLWYLWGAENPFTCSYISTKEKRFLSLHLKDISIIKNKDIPWKKIFMNSNFMVTMIAHSTNNWCFWFLVFEIPVYLQDVLFISSGESKFFALLPYATTYMSSFITAYTLDLFVSGNITSVTNSRKLCNTIALWGTMLSFTAMLITETSFSSIAMYALAVVLNYYSFFGHVINYIDLSPNFCGLLIGIANCLGNIPPCIGYSLVSTLVQDTSVSEDWDPAFIMTAGAAFLGGLFFLGGGSCNVQKFNIPEFRMKRKKETSSSSLKSSQSLSDSETSFFDPDRTQITENISSQSEIPPRRPSTGIGRIIQRPTVANVVRMVALQWKGKTSSSPFIKLEHELSKGAAGPISQSQAIVNPIIHDLITAATLRQFQRRQTFFDRRSRKTDSLGNSRQVTPERESPSEIAQGTVEDAIADATYISTLDESSSLIHGGPSRSSIKSLRLSPSKYQNKK